VAWRRADTLRDGNTTYTGRVRPRLALRRTLFWSLPAVAAVGALLGVRAAWRRADLALAGEAMAAGRLQEVHALLAGRSDAPARTGLALVRLLQGDGGPDALAPPIDLEAYRISVILDQALGRGDFEGCRRLAAALTGQGVAAHSHLAAALLELGRDAEARAALGEPSSRDGLGVEVASALERRAAGARTMVRDTRGRLMGVLDGDGRLTLLDPDGASWVPSEALAAAASGQAAPAGLRTSVDEGLSRLALGALGAERGTIVLLDAATGAVLAAVSDARTQEESGRAAWTQHREPASIAKLITTTAALRAGLDPDAEIAGMTCAGHATYGRGQLWCTFPGGQLAGLGHALAISCNVAFANLGLKLGAARLLEEYGRYGFQPPGGADAGARIRKPPEDDRQLADLAVGLEATDITPVHGARMAAVFAAGRLPTAHVLAARDGALGRTPRALPVEAGVQVVDPRWLPLLTRSMEAVTGPGGTAGGLDPPGFQVAMKTGTAAEPGSGYHVNYIGVGPQPHPPIAICGRLTPRGSSPDISRRARQVLATLLGSLGAD
jgi:hypothetical protein